MGQLFEDLVVKWGTIKAYEIAEEVAEEKAEEIAKEKAEEIAKEKALEEKKASARRMIARGKLTLEEIADCVSLLSLEELKELEAEMTELV